MTRQVRSGVITAERLIAWVIFDGNSAITAGELKQMIEKIFGAEIAAIVQQRVKDEQVFDPIEDE